MGLNIGIIEGFFGPPWPMSARADYAAFSKANNLAFYIYAPKQDQNLRKNWRRPHSPEALQALAELSTTYRKHQVPFGIGFSPLDLCYSSAEADLDIFKRRLEGITSLGIDILGLFFDDMQSRPDLAEKQVRLVNIAKQMISAKILFCPTFYSYDPILDKVFGERPPNYLKDIGTHIPQGIDIVWTGNNVIPKTIEVDHLQEVTTLLKRPPFLWDNLYANDGPKQCYKLKLTPPKGRAQESIQIAAGWGLNPMNQAYLSKIVLKAFSIFAHGDICEREAFLDAIDALHPGHLGKIIKENAIIFTETGLQGITEEKKTNLKKSLWQLEDPAARELLSWLDGDFIVGSECLTD